VVGVRRLDHALLKFGWASEKSWRSNSEKLLIQQKAYALLYTYNGWPMMKDYIQKLGLKTDWEGYNPSEECDFNFWLAKTNASYQALDELIGGEFT